MLDRIQSVQVAIGGFLLGLVPLATAQAAVVISSAQTQNMSCANGVCAPTASDAVLNVGDLETLLASGNVEVTTTGSGVQADNVEISNALAWSSTSTLILDAYQSITIDKAVTISGAGGLTITTNDGGSGGYFAFGAKGQVTFADLSSTLTINGTSYALEGDIKSLASAITNDPSGAFALANNYDASGDGTYSASPIQTTFAGAFEGLGNAITHLTINGSGFIGLFSVEYGTLENLNLLDVHLTVQGGSQAGGLAGAAANVSHVRVTGSIRGTGDSGNNMGGMVGSGGPFSYCAANVRIDGDQQSAIGGLVSVSDADIVESFATGAITATGNSYVGGLASFNSGNIQDSYATGAVTGGAHSDVGGLVGADAIGRGVPGTIETSYSTGTVSGAHPSEVGGFAGYTTNRHGAFFQDSYWDTTTSGTDKGVGRGNHRGIAGLTTHQLQSGLPTGFDPTIWAENPNINNGLPYLIANPPVQ